LKPSNIILTRDHQEQLQVKVVDFGVAKLKEFSTTGGGLTASGSLIGTPRYMSPEQCAGHTTDARSDIYSIGVMLFEMLAGQPPFDAPSATAIAIKHIQQPSPSLKEFRPDSSIELERFLHRVLDKDPERRPQTASDFAKELSEATTAANVNGITSSPPTEKQDNSQQADKAASGRETNAFPLEAGTTFRAGDPTLEHPSSAAQQLDDAPSVQGYVGAVEAGTEVATKVSAPITERSAVVYNESSSQAEAMPPRAIEPQGNHTQEARNPGSKRSALIYAIAIFSVGFIAIALWLALTRSSQKTAERASASETSQAGKSAPELSPTRTAESPAPVDTSNRVIGNDAQTKPPAEARVELRAALNDWIAATNSRDINRQMVFYAPTLSIFYRKRNATISSVRAEKAGLLAQVDSVEVRATDPEIQLDTDGQAATMRFHKSWNFSGRRPESGEVIQELRWRKMDSGWKIVSERDVEVIRLAK
jgi:serine/threonine protein kinase/ketosteroid isomerase-like protein